MSIRYAIGTRLNSKKFLYSFLILFTVLPINITFMIGNRWSPIKNTIVSNAQLTSQINLESMFVYIFVSCSFASIICGQAFLYSFSARYNGILKIVHTMLRLYWSRTFHWLSLQNKSCSYIYILVHGVFFFFFKEINIFNENV